MNIRKRPNKTLELTSRQAWLMRQIFYSQNDVVPSVLEDWDQEDQRRIRELLEAEYAAEHLNDNGWVGLFLTEAGRKKLQDWMETHADY